MREIKRPIKLEGNPYILLTQIYSLSKKEGYCWKSNQLLRMNGIQGWKASRPGVGRKVSAPGWIEVQVNNHSKHRKRLMRLTPLGYWRLYWAHPIKVRAKWKAPRSLITPTNPGHDQNGLSECFLITPTPTTGSCLGRSWIVAFKESQSDPNSSQVSTTARRPQRKISLRFGAMSGWNSRTGYRHLFISPSFFRWWVRSGTEGLPSGPPDEQLVKHIQSRYFPIIQETLRENAWMGSVKLQATG